MRGPQVLPPSATEIEDSRPSANQTLSREVEEQLQRILRSAIFCNAPRHSRFLDFTVHKTLSGQGESVKEYLIGLEVFDRPSHFDPRSDPTVRAEARRLRSRLAEYYAGPGQCDAVLIDLPKGTYVPVFSRRTDPVRPSANTALPAATPTLPLWRSRVAWFCAALLMVLTAVLLLVYRRASDEPAMVADSIAVLPFVNLSDHPDRQYLADGVAEELTTRLAQLNGLRVVAATSAFQFRGKGEDVRRIGQQLNARALLEGSITGWPGRMRINAQLVSTKDGYHLWSKAYDVDPDSVFDTEDDIAAETAKALGLHVEPRPSSHPSTRETKSPGAHELYLQGRYYLNKRDFPDMERALSLFQAATEKDPNFALAYEGLGDTYAVMGGNDEKPVSEVAPKAKAALLRALELDPALAEAYTTLALVNSEATGSRRGLERDLRHALELSPGSGRAHHWLGMILIGQGRFPEADAELRYAQLLDPLSPMITEGVAENYYYWRRYDDALQQLDKLQQMNFAGSEVMLGLCYIQKRRYQDAIQLFRAMQHHDASSVPLLYLAMARAAAGESDDARQLLNQALTHKAFDSPYEVARVYLLLNDRNTAIQWLHRAAAQKDPSMGWLKVDPMFDSIRSHPEYRVLLKEADLNN